MEKLLSCENKGKNRDKDTHHHAGLHSSSPARPVQSCCGESCWGCWSTPPSPLHCLQPTGMCFYPASSAQRQSDALCCSKRKKNTFVYYSVITLLFYGFNSPIRKLLDLNNTHAWVQEDGSFGLFGGVFIFVEVDVVGSISKLSQMEVPSLEGLQDEHRTY